MSAESYTESVHINAEPGRVFDHFTDAAALTSWMGRQARLDPQPGGEFSLDFHRARVRGRYVSVERPTRLVISWGHEGSDLLPPGASIVEVTFSADSGGTLVRLVHRGLPTQERPRHAIGWQHFLPRLATLAAGTDPGPDPWLSRPPEFVTRPLPPRRAGPHQRSA